MLKWDKTDPHIAITHAYPCAINRGILDKNGICPDLPYVDDALMLAIDRAHMETILAAAIEAIQNRIQAMSSCNGQVVGVGHWADADHAGSYH
jgi:hypothetical protein